MSEFVKVKNISSFNITINLPNVRYRRDLDTNQEARMNDEVFEEFNYDPGCRSLVREGFLAVITDDEEIRESVEVTEKTTVQEIPNLKDLLTVQPPMELFKVLQEASPALKDMIVEEAIKNSVADAARVNMIAKYTGVNIVNALALQRQG